MLDDVTGKVALVTGANRGIGRAVALELGKRGARVAVNFRTRRAEAEEVCSQLESMGQASVAVAADVSLPAEVARMVGEVENRLGPISILVNNAGISRPEPVDRITEQSWDEILDCNLKSQFLVIQAVLPAMRKLGWGRIVNMSSIAAQIGGVVGPHYAASKAGVLGLTHYYAALLVKEGITVNAIAPALIETEMVTSNPNARADLIPVGRFGTVDEVADVALTLIGNGYITGQTINVNGGWRMS